MKTRLLSFLLFLLSGTLMFAQDSPNTFEHINRDRNEVIRKYREIYLTAHAVPENWEDPGNCRPGKLPERTLDARLTEINYFRDHAGLEPVSLDPEKNRLAQAAAVLMDKNGSLSHSPPKDWNCWSADGAQGAGSSNLGLGGSLINFMFDFGSNNRSCGHRMWLLNSKATTFGYGGTGYTRATFVFGDNQKKDSVPQFVAWPTAGFNPVEIINSRWTFALPDEWANFGNAKVTVRFEGRELPLVYSQPTGYGESGLAFELDNWNKLEDRIMGKKVEVSVSNIKIRNQVRQYRYEVILVKATPDEEWEMAPHVKILAVVDQDKTMTHISQVKQDNILSALTFLKLMESASAELEYSEAFSTLANRIAEIRRDKHPDTAKLVAYTGKKVLEELEKGAFSTTSSDHQPDFLLVEAKKLVPLTGAATFRETAEALSQELMADKNLMAFIKKHPKARHTGVGFATKRVVKNGRNCVGVYAALIMAPGQLPSPGGASGQGR